MKILLICIFTWQTFIPSFITAEQDSNNKPVLCEFSYAANNTYTFDISDVPEFCDIVVFGWYSLELYSIVDGHVNENTKSTLRALKKNNKIVYVIVIHNPPDNSLWGKILDWQCKGDDYKEYIDPLKKFINEWNISGIIIYRPPIYDIDQAEDKLNLFIKDIRTVKKDLKIGINILLNDYDNLPCNNLFDFTKVNKFVDYYMIDFAIQDCNSITKYIGVTPISSTDENVGTMDMVFDVVNRSTMDPLKLIGVIPVMPTTMDGLQYTYAQYCKDDEATRCKICIDTSQTFYNQGGFISKYFNGMWITQVSTDDYGGFCKCQKFPITNMVVNGFKGKPLTCCPELDKF